MDTVKWANYKRKDALRKSNYRRTAERNDPVLFESIKLNERARQIKSREKVKKQESDNISPAFTSKSSKARSVVRVSRALPKQYDQRKEVVRDLTVEAIDATPRKKRAIAKLFGDCCILREIYRAVSSRVDFISHDIIFIHNCDQDL